MDRYRDSYLQEIRAFLSAVRIGGPSPVSGEDGRAPVVMALAAREEADACMQLDLSYQHI